MAPRVTPSAEVADAVSRGLVLPIAPDGGQRQCVERPVTDVRDTSLGPLPAWAWDQPGEPLTVAGPRARRARPCPPPGSSSAGTSGWV
ncbi:hypothetical protein QFZ32_004656 [Streptomyces canus]|nr:hypothetical protein [Streptomyces canus]MDQ1069216.1 hypothetical protein [Streptomyces canus]